jgi:hypothetical protein
MGPGKTKGQEIYDKLPPESKKNFDLDNDGNVVSKNRAYRRRKPPTDNWETKATHSIKKKRAKINAKNKHNRRSS